jgi:hypothetical protein
VTSPRFTRGTKIAATVAAQLERIPPSGPNVPTGSGSCGPRWTTKHRGRPRGGIPPMSMPPPPGPPPPPSPPPSVGSTPTAPPYPARLEIDYPERLNRVTTAFRIILIIPIAVVLGILTDNGSTTWVSNDGEWVTTTGTSIVGALFMVTLLMILFRQRYPRWWFDFALELSRFSARVTAYFALLTDEYPSTVEEQRVHLEFDYPDDVERDLNRWLPLVKWFLAIPHFIISVLLVDRRLLRRDRCVVRHRVHRAISPRVVRLRGRRRSLVVAGVRVCIPADHRSVSAVRTGLRRRRAQGDLTPPWGRRP